MVAAYSATAGRWQTGPGLVYDRLAVELIAAAPVPVRGADVLDLGTGTGAATRAALAAGARRVVPVDAAVGMLQVDTDRRPPGVCGHASALPIRDSSVDVVVAAFSLNHVADPVPALREVTRVLRPGGGAVVGAYGAEDHHPVKDAVERTLTGAGWHPPSWHAWLKTHASVALSTVTSTHQAAARAGLHVVEVVHRRITFPHLTPQDLVEWRFGMAQHAPFLAALTPRRRAALAEQACNQLGACAPPLVRSVIFLTFLG